MKRRAENQGFTLAEAVLILATVGVLSLIAVPIIGKMIEKTKIGRAEADIRRIKDALEAFYSDVNLLPRKGASGLDVYNTLVSGESVVTTRPYGFMSHRAEDPTTQWVHGEYTPSADPTDTTDTLNNHLVFNTPAGNGAYKYPTTLINAWNGPYSTPIGLDPWGHPYLALIDIDPNARVEDLPRRDASFGRWIVCAGPDGLITSKFPPTCTSGLQHSRAADDDIIAWWGCDPP